MCFCGDSECPSCGTAQGTRTIYTGKRCPRCLEVFKSRFGMEMHLSLDHNISPKQAEKARRKA